LNRINQNHSYFIYFNPTTSDYKTALGLVPELGVIKVLEWLNMIDEVLKEPASIRKHAKEELKSYLLGEKFKIK
jgi:hypothetical protein